MEFTSYELTEICDLTERLVKLCCQEERGIVVSEVGPDIFGALITRLSTAKQSDLMFDAMPESYAADHSSDDLLKVSGVPYPVPRSSVEQDKATE